MIKVAILCMLLAVASGQFNSRRRNQHAPRFLSGQSFQPPRQQSFNVREETFNPVQQSFDHREQSFAQRDQHHAVPERYVIIPILRFDQHGPENGFYSFEFESGDGTRRQEEGSPDGPNGGLTKSGSWSHSFPDGTHGEFKFVSDVHGYRVESPLLPVGPAIPAHAQAQIEKAERERAAGIFHDGFYDHARYGGPGANVAPAQPRHQHRRRFN